MGIVASLAAIPVAEDVVRDEKRRELQKCLEEEERLRRLKLGEYRQGDLDLELIKRGIIIICKGKIIDLDLVLANVTMKT